MQCVYQSTGVHKSGFIVFIGSSLLHMLCTCKLWSVIAKNSLSAEVMRFLYSGLVHICYKHVSRGRYKPSQLIQQLYCCKPCWKFC